MMKHASFLVLLTFISIVSQAQLGVIGNNKPLGFLNPALQNYSIDKGVVSASYVMNPFIQDKSPSDYLVLAEFQLGANMRAGLHTGKVENRLNASTSTKAYISYKLELEKGSYLTFGADAGYYTDVLKPAEFNKVYSPNVFVYQDSATSGLDVGFGAAYQYNGFTVGFGFSKLNRPEVYNFPVPFFEVEYDTIVIGGNQFVDSSYVLRDTVVNVPEGQGQFGTQSNINVMYEWDASEKISLIHSLHFGNVDLGGADYIGFQNIANINKRHSLGIGIFYNGFTGYNLSAGYGITESIKIEASAFFIEEFNYNTTDRVYESDGYKPLIELNARYQF